MYNFLFSFKLDGRSRLNKYNNKRKEPCSSVAREGRLVAIDGSLTKSSSSCDDTASLAIASIWLGSSNICVDEAIQHYRY